MAIKKAAIDEFKAEPFTRMAWQEASKPLFWGGLLQSAHNTRKFVLAYLEKHCTPDPLRPRTFVYETEGKSARIVLEHVELILDVVGLDNHTLIRHRLFIAETADEFRRLEQLLDEILAHL